MDRRERIALLVDRALELTPAERQDFLAAQGDDDDVRREVEELLAAGEEMESGFLEQPAAVGLRGPDPDEGPAGPDPMVGRMVGAYRLETLLGRGGMGAVYLARRADDEYEHQVAVKLLHPGLASAGLVRRFRSERQILARLDHPNIAKLLDGGTTEDGQPYLVMEPIDGSRIDDYCDEHGLGVRERLLLFREVCDAVRFAHQNLVVHRDLKPSNILVTAQGTPKLLDFGIAKLVDAPELPPSGEVTKSLLHAMTPSYASPEQLAGRNVTTVSDVYSLGVILYKLLTGRLPRQIDLRSPQALDAVLAREPEKPSVAAGREDDEALGPLGGRRRRDARQLRRQLSGDLDTIVSMALRPEPERRYGSVEQLMDDLRRHLDGLPVRARRDTFTYRAAKFLRRNRVALSAAAVIFALALGLAATATLQARRIAREREAAEQQRARAERERDKAQRVSKFMAALFETAGNAQGITARELLDQGAAKLHGELEGEDPEVRAAMLAAVGRVYGQMGLFIEAKRHLGEALQIREKLFGPDDLEVAEVANDLGWAAQEAGELGEAEQQASRAVTIRERQLGPNDPLIAESLLVLATTYSGAQRLDAAEELTERALRIHINRFGPASAEVSATLNELGLIYRDRGKLVEAETAFRRSVDIDERLPASDVAMATALNNLALVLHDRGLLAEAAPYYRRSIELKERSTGPTPKLAASLSNLALIEHSLGLYDQAEQRLLRAQEICEKALGPENLYVGIILASRGLNHRDRGELALAEPMLQRSLRMVEAAVGPEHREYAKKLLLYADLDFRRGRVAAAAAAQERGLGILRQRVGPAHSEVSAATRDLARMVASRGDAGRAATLLAEVVAATEARLKEQPENREDLALLASALVDTGRLAAAAGDAQTAAARFRRALELVAPFAVDSQVIDYGRVYAEALVLLGRGEEARPLIERLLATGWRDPRFLSLLDEHGLR